MTKNVFYFYAIMISFIAIIVFVAMGFTISVIMKNVVLAEYKNAVVFSTEQYSNNLAFDRQKSLDNIESICLDINNYNRYFGQYDMIGRISINKNDGIMTVGIINKSRYLLHDYHTDLPYDFWTVNEDNKNIIANNQVVYYNLNTLFTKAGFYTCNQYENITYQLLVKQRVDSNPDADPYFYLLIQKANQVFVNKDSYNITNCAFIDSDGYQLLGTKNGINNYVTPNNIISGKQIFDCYDKGLIGLTNAFKISEKDVVFANNIDYHTIVNYVDNSTRAIILIFCFLAFLSLSLVVGSITMFLYRNNYLKSFNQKSKQSYVITTDTDGNILKTNDEFKQQFSTNNIFRAQNINKDFLKLGNTDSLFLKLRNNKGEAVLLNFLTVRLGSKYKLVGTRTTNIDEFYRLEREYGALNSELGLYNEEKLKSVYSEVLEETNRRILGIFEISNLGLLGKMFGREFYAKTQKEFAKKINKHFGKWSDVYAIEDGRKFGIFVYDEKGVEYFMKNKENIVQDICSQLIIDNKITNADIQVGFVVIDDTLKDKSYQMVNKLAFTALQKAKSTRKSRYYIYHETNNEEFKNIVVNYNIEKMIDDGNFIVYFQPQCDTKTLEVKGFESLLRLRGEQYKNTKISELVEYAEHTNKIGLITTVVMEQAINFAQSLMNKKINATVSINVSGGEIFQSYFTKILKEKIALYNVKAENIVLEITETTYLGDLKIASKVMTELKQDGFRFHIDDFGKHYSTFDYITQLPTDGIKLDYGLIKNLGRDQNTDSVVKAMLTFCKESNLECVAEGVEREEQRKILAGLDCDFIQGFLISPSIAPQDAINLAIKLRGEK